MPYVNTTAMLKKARKERYVVGAFNIVNQTSMRAVIEAAKEEKSPIIIQTSQKTVIDLGYKVLTSMIGELADDVEIPVAMNLDHGTDMEVIGKCIDFGWSSVMVDGSRLPYGQNIKLTKKVVEMAHNQGVSVEGELGHIGGKEEHVEAGDSKIMLTEPQKAVEFQEKTGVDSLAVAIGTAHGLYKGEPRLDFDRLAEIMKVTSFPIVIHGCSGLSEEILKKIISYRVSKMNISTELKHCYIDACDEYIEKYPDEYEPLKKFKFVQDEVKKLVKEYINLFGSKGKA